MGRSLSILVCSWFICCRTAWYRKQDKLATILHLCKRTVTCTLSRGIHDAVLNARAKFYKKLKTKITPYYASAGTEERRRYSLDPFTTSALEWSGLSAPRSGRSTPMKEELPFLHKAGCASRPVWRGTENLALPGIRSRDRPCRSESPYRLLY